MAPRRGEAAKERREGDTAELGEKISSIEGKFSTLEVTVEGRLGSMEEMLRQLVEAQTRAQITSEKGKGPNPNPNPVIHSVEEEEELLMGGVVPPPMYTGEAQWQAPATGYARGGHISRGGWSGHLGPMGDMGKGLVGPTMVAEGMIGDNAADGSTRNPQGGGISDHPIEEKGHDRRERLSTRARGERGDSLTGRTGG